MPNRWESDVEEVRKHVCPCGRGFYVEELIKHTHNSAPRVDWSRSYWMECQECKPKYVHDDIRGWVSVGDVERRNVAYKEYKESEKKMKEYFFENHIDQIVNYFETKPKNAIYKVLQKHHAAIVYGTENTFRKHFRGARNFLKSNATVEVVGAVIDEMQIHDSEMKRLIIETKHFQREWLK